MTATETQRHNAELLAAWPIKLYLGPRSHANGPLIVARTRAAALAHFRGLADGASQDDLHALPALSLCDGRTEEPVNAVAVARVEQGHHELADLVATAGEVQALAKAMVERIKAVQSVQDAISGYELNRVAYTQMSSFRHELEQLTDWRRALLLDVTSLAEARALHLE